MTTPADSERQARRALADILGFDPSEPQFAALAAELRPGVVVAGAGSGKTAVMSARMLWLILTGQAAPGHLLGLTFTNKAAHELLTRTRDYLATARREHFLPESDEADDDPRIATYHSFAAGIITEHGLRIGIEPSSRLLADGARHQLAARIIATTDRDMSDVNWAPPEVVGRVLALDDAMAELGLDPGEVRDDARSLIAALDQVEHAGSLIQIGREMRDTAILRITLTGLVEDFRAAKRARGALDFADQVRLALQIVAEFPDVREQLRATHRVVLLDEYQDTSIAQRKLLQKVFADGHPVMAVGDPCQAIYEWRGASVVNIERFREHFPIIGVDGEQRPADRFPLLDNRRSGPVILELANIVSAPLRADRVDLDPLIPAPRTDPHPGHVRVGFLDTIEDEIEFVADQVVECGGSSGAWGGILVLARTADHLRRLDRALRERGAPTQLIGTASLLAEPVVREVWAYLEVIADATANASLVRILSGPRWRIGARDLAVLGAIAAELAGGPRKSPGSVADALVAAVSTRANDDHPSLLEAVFAVADGPSSADDGPGADLSTEAVERIGECARMLRDLRSHDNEAPVDLIGRVLAVTGLGAQSMVGREIEVAERGRALQEFIDLAARFDDLDGRVNLAAFLARLADAQAYDAAPTFEPVADPGAVRLMSVHKAKGLEAPHVFVAGLAAGKFPSTLRRPRWPKRPEVIPWRLRDDAPPHLSAWPDLAEGPHTNDTKQFTADANALEDEEERRLAYVAITRAQRTVTLTGYGWGTASGYRGPGEFLLEAREFCLGGGGEILVWADPPEDGATNPVLDHSRRDWRWPAQSDSAARQAAADVLAALDGESLNPDPAVEFTTSVRDLIAEERARRRPVEVTVPDRVSVSDLVRWQADPGEMEQRWARPMPTPPSGAAYRGALLHAWIEQHYRARSLLSLDDIPGAVDDGIDTAAWFTRAKESFLATEWAQRAPVAIEEPFVVMLDDREVRGRIDAVFNVEGRDVIVDWKTGAPGSADPGQLEIYRTAWAAITGQPREQITAEFVYL
jgi:DNA helicase II / ATP-dependent DNA helicase PcrA